VSGNIAISSGRLTVSSGIVNALNITLDFGLINMYGEINLLDPLTGKRGNLTVGNGSSVQTGGGLNVTLVGNLIATSRAPNVSASLNIGIDQALQVTDANTNLTVSGDCTLGAGSASLFYVSGAGSSALTVEGILTIANRASIHLSAATGEAATLKERFVSFL
jgi:hypothetical protein